MKKIYIYKEGENLKEINYLPKTLKVNEKIIFGFNNLSDIELRTYNYYPAYLDIPSITEYQKLGIKEIIYREETDDYLITRNVVDKSEQELLEMLNSLKFIKIQEVKRNGENIIFSKYPLYKQQNMTAEQQYAVHAITQLEKTINNFAVNSDTVIYNATMKIGMIDTIPELNFLENNLPSVDDLSITPEIREYYRQIILSIIVFRKIRLVRQIINNKINEINTIEDYEVLKNYNTEIDIEEF